MNIGDKAPKILGKDEQGRDIRLSDYKGLSSYCISIQRITPADVLLRLVA